MRHLTRGAMIDEFFKYFADNFKKINQKTLVFYDGEEKLDLR